MKSPLGRSGILWPILAVGTALSPLLVGIEPVGGDPDRLYRPLKTELVRAFHTGRLPFWSDRLGLGVPLLAESHVGALYPPNHLLYRGLDVSTAYRLAMWAHMIALAAGTFAYARALGLGRAGATLAAVAFSLCGFLAVHSSHEWAYLSLAFLPWLLLCADRACVTGRCVCWAGFALVLGVGWTVGHFQMLAWSLPIVFATCLGRLWGQPGALVRGLCGLIGVGLGMMVGAAQLGPSWEYARFVGPEQRSAAERAFYAFPLAHWPEPFLPRQFRQIDPEAPYWFSQETTGYEACLYIGTLPLICAFVGALGRNRMVRVWLLLIVLTLGLATMPHWWRAGYLALLKVPGLGLFRCPARWTAFSSMGLALLAGAGFDRAIPTRRFWLGVGLAVVAALAAIGWALVWERTVVSRREGLFEPISLMTWLWPGLAWLAALGALIAWRTGKVPAAVPIALATLELSALYYTMTTRWGWPIDPARSSPTFRWLEAESPASRVGGVLDDLPLRSGLTTAEPYVGFPLPEPNRTLHRLWSRPEVLADPRLRAWASRCGVTHVVLDRPADLPRSLDALRVHSGSDPALDLLARSPRSGKLWEVLELGDQGSAVRLISQVRVLPDESAALRAAIEGRVDRGETVVAADLGVMPRHTISQGTIREWDGLVALVDHSDAIGLVITRQHDPGWEYRIGAGAWRTVGRAEGGLQFLWIEGPGPSRIETRYRPPHWRLWCGISIVSGTFACLLLIVGLLHARGHRSSTISERSVEASS
jgi:hypothetical protein